ncbi:regulatory protein RecX [Sediminibacterium roseum]|nr:regulatory protein RecX [Sediminibacterium roseum]
MTTLKKNLTPLLAYPKIKHYCGYSERCHYEVREKLFGMGLVKKDVEILLSRLIEEDYLNEERFAVLFAGGHFRQKKWGRTKIIHALRQKRVSEPNIKRAMKEIAEEDYLATLRKLADTKWKSLKGEQYITREAKTMAFLMQRGFESPAIRQVLAVIRAGNKE